jgi:hypothetical protein
VVTQVALFGAVDLVVVDSAEVVAMVADSVDLVAAVLVAAAQVETGKTTVT